VTFGSEGVGDDALNGKPPSTVEQVPAWLARNGGRFTPHDASRLEEAAGEIVFESDTLDAMKGTCTF
jgi:hypothetical protein